MKQAIHENIKRYRKEKNFTQENLAEAMGVSVGAVSKWESGASIPELPLILELADFFEISVDALLGYKARSNTAKQTAQRIKTLSQNRQFDECRAEIEKALVKHPNHLQVVYQSASACHNIGLELHTEKDLRRCLALFEHALTLLGDTTDEGIDATRIYGYMASVYNLLEENDKALALLKAHNARGTFNGDIGFLLATHFHGSKDALPYLSDALLECLQNIFQIGVGLANVYGNHNAPEKGIEALAAAMAVNNLFTTPGKPSYLEKTNVILLVGIAQLYNQQGDRESTRRCLIEAKKLAQYYDQDPDPSAKNIRFYCKTSEIAFSYDDFGQTAMEGIEHIIAESAQETPTLLSLWEEVKHLAD